MEEIINFKNKIFKKIKGAEHQYINKIGDVYSTKHNRIMKQCIGKIGYSYIRFKIYGKIKLLTIHRLVALTWIPNPNSYPQVNHINGIRNDNRVENLEWDTQKHNMQHSYRVLKNNKGCFKKGCRQYLLEKKVKQIDKNNNKIIKIWKSVSEAQRQLKIGGISNVCLKKPYSKSVGGFKWEYL